MIIQELERIITGRILPRAPSSILKKYAVDEWKDVPFYEDIDDYKWSKTPIMAQTLVYAIIERNENLVLQIFDKVISDIKEKTISRNRETLQRQKEVKPIYSKISDIKAFGTSLYEFDQLCQRNPREQRPAHLPPIICYREILSKIINLLALMGMTKVLEHAFQLGIAFGIDSEYLAIAGKNMDTFLLIRSKIGLLSGLDIRAIQSDNLDVIKYLYKREYEINPDIDLFAAEYGRLDIFKWLIGCNLIMLRPKLSCKAVNSGNTKILDMLYDMKCPFDKSEASYVAAYNNNNTLVNWLNQHSLLDDISVNKAQANRINDIYRTIRPPPTATTFDIKLESTLKAIMRQHII